MICHVCGANMTKLQTNLPFKLCRDTIVILKDLPVIQCEVCGEYLLKDTVMGEVDRILERVSDTAELEVLKYAA